MQRWLESDSRMQRLRQWFAATWLSLMCFVPLELRAAQSAVANPPPRVVIHLVGRLQREATMDARIRSLFDGRTEVLVRRTESLASQRVLNPEVAQTVYLWISLGPDLRARFYAATREQGTGGTRYLFREVELETGLDELGGETLAQVAESCAGALWARDQETSKETLAGQLAQERAPLGTGAAAGGVSGAAAPRVKAKPAARANAIQAPSSGASSTPATQTHEPNEARTSVAPAWRLDAGIEQSVRRAGDEGWLNQTGVHVTWIWARRFSIRTTASYLIPTEFAAGPSRVALSGYAMDARLGWNTSAQGPRIRLEVGSGGWLHHWQVIRTTAAGARREGRDWRAYWVGAFVFEVPIGPIWVGARLELLTPLQRTYYELIQEAKVMRVAESWLAAGTAFEVTIPLMGR